MARIVMKFGGTSVADIARIRNVARHVKREVDAGHEVAVVVSAMSGKTNELVGWVQACRRRRSHAILRRARIRRGGRLGRAGDVRACWRSRCRRWASTRAPGRAGRSRSRTDNAHGAARIADIDGSDLIKRFGEGAGRGGRRLPGHRPGQPASRRSAAAARTPRAVAIAAAVKADRCDIYTDVDGVYTTDPRIEPKARRLAKISFEEMLEMASLGAKVLQVRSVELAMVHKVRTFVRSSFDDPGRAGHGRSAEPARNAHLRRG
ncbi:MAG: hypothetical protein V9G04_18030 [Nocardioides sp.]